MFRGLGFRGLRFWVASGLGIATVVHMSILCIGTHVPLAERKACPFILNRDDQPSRISETCLNQGVHVGFLQQTWGCLLPAPQP